MELLTQDIARTYQNRAKLLPFNGIQDIGERRALRVELQERFGVTELEAVNIINGFHVDDYCMKYRIKAWEAAQKKPELPKMKRHKQSRKEIY